MVDTNSQAPSGRKRGADEAANDAVGSMAAADAMPSEDEIDEAIEMTFPASDPPAYMARAPHTPREGKP